MEQIGFGLIDRGLLRQFAEYWNRGGVGVLYVKLPAGWETAGKSVQGWAEKTPHLFWQSRIGSDCLFFLHRSGKQEKLSAVLGEAKRSLAAALAVRDGGEPVIGTAAAKPDGSGRSAETAVFSAVKEAMWTARLARKGAGAGPPVPAVHKALPDTGNGVSIGQLAEPIPVFARDTPVSEVAGLFEQDPAAQGAVIVDDGRPVGLVVKEKLHQLLAGQFGLPLYWSRPVERIMDEEALVVEADCPVEQASQLAMARAFHKLYDVVIITQGGKLAGAASIRAILECVTALRTEAARTANPLTGLPGNEGVQRELQRRIAAGRPFAVIYADLDYFKWFNDCFGFRRGDELIRYTADVLQQVVGLSGGSGDFVGHIGGDDFIVVTEAPDPDTLCRHIVWRFDGGVKPFYGGVEVASVIARDGSELASEGVSISLSLAIWDGLAPVTPESFSALSAKLKKQAKRVLGSSYAAERIEAGHQIELQLGVERP